MPLPIGNNMQVVHRLASLKALGVHMAVLGHLYLQPLGQSIYHRGAYAVQTAGYFIAGAAELTAGVEYGEHHRYSRQAGLFVNAGGNTTAVIPHANHITGQNLRLNVGADPGQCLVNGVVHNLIHQVVQTSGAGGADIHTRALADGLQALQHLNIFCGIFFRYNGVHIRFFQNSLFFFSHNFCLSAHKGVLRTVGRCGACVRILSKMGYFHRLIRVLTFRGLIYTVSLVST